MHPLPQEATGGSFLPKQGIQSRQRETWDPGHMESNLGERARKVSDGGKGKCRGSSRATP